MEFQIREMNSFVTQSVPSRACGKNQGIEFVDEGDHGANVSVGPENS